MSQRIGLSVTSLLPEKRRPGQEAARSAAAGVEGRSAGRGYGTGFGAGLVARGRGGARRPLASGGPLGAAAPTSPPLLLRRSQFPPRPETWRAFRL